MAMTSKERMMTALNLEKPDRVPVTIHQWQPYHLKYFMDGMSDFEAFKSTGLDAAITRCPWIERESADWRITAKEKDSGEYKLIDFQVETPEGNLTYQRGHNEMTSWTTEHIIKNDEDIYLIKKYMPIPLLDKKQLEKDYDRLGEDGIMRTFIIGYQGGCWQDACELYGMEQMIMATFDKPEWVHELMQILSDRKLAYIEESLKGAKVDLVETGGGASSNTVISPAIHEEFCLPYDRKMHDLLRNVGHKSVYHTCGGMTKILDLILQNGCDASETLSPVGVGGDITNAEVVVEKFVGKLAMIGGMDQMSILTDGKPEDIRKEVFRLFDAFGKNGGYIMSASDHFFHAPRENIFAFAEAAKECVYK